MNNRIGIARGLLGRNTYERILLLVVIAVVCTITAINPVFLSIANLFDILRIMTVTGIMALGSLLVIISGGIDVSFPAIADTAAFAAAMFLVSRHFNGSWVMLFLVAIPLGVLMGLINGFFVGKFHVPAMIVTLGTQSLFYGASLYFLGGVSIFELPRGTTEFSRIALVTVHAAKGTGSSSLNPTFLILVVIAAGISVMLRRTVFGRLLYSLGNREELVRRSGINVFVVYMILYALVGALSAIAGAANATLYRNANPISLQGQDLSTIAAVVLGGASITGGRGTVSGTMLGVLLIAIIQNSLVLIGIPTTWQNVVVGLVLVIGIAIPVIQRRASMGLGQQVII